MLFGSFENVNVFTSHWFSALADQRFDLIISNPPYIAAVTFTWLKAMCVSNRKAPWLPALMAWTIFARLSPVSASHLNAGGWLMLEHGYDQAEAVRQLLQDAGFAQVESRKDLGGQ